MSPTGGARVRSRFELRSWPGVEIHRGATRPCPRGCRHRSHGPLVNATGLSDEGRRLTPLLARWHGGGARAGCDCGTEALVHLYAVWMPDHTDAMAAVEKRVGLTRSRSYSSSWRRGNGRFRAFARRGVSHPCQIVNARPIG